MNNTSGETFGLLCLAEITEFAEKLHSEMEKFIIMDEIAIQTIKILKSILGEEESYYADVAYR